MHTKLLGRAAAVVAAAAVVGASALGLASPAHATVADANSGGSLSRQLVVERALSWVDQNVSYDQSLYFPASAPRTGAGHGFRQDCSGFVSMAWDLPSSAVTGDFVSASSPYDTALPSWDALQPGDLLGVSGHVILFLGWSANDNGAHRYFDMVSEAHSGTTTSVQTGQDRQGYWKSYAPYRYDKIVDDAPVSVTPSSGRTDQFQLGADRHLTHRWSFDGGTTWAAEDMTAKYGTKPLRTGLTATSAGDGKITIFGVGVDGQLHEVFWDPAAVKWTERTFARPAAVVGLSAIPSGTGFDLYARQHGTDAPGSLVTAHEAGGTLGSWTAVSGAPAMGGDPTAVRVNDTTVDVQYVAADGTPTEGVTGGGSWTFGTAGSVAPPPRTDVHLAGRQRSHKK